MFVRETWKIATVLYEECTGFGQSNIAVLQMGSPRSRKNSLENLPLEASIFSSAWIKTVISFKKNFFLGSFRNFQNMLFSAEIWKVVSDLQDFINTFWEGIIRWEHILRKRQKLSEHLPSNFILLKQNAKKPTPSFSRFNKKSTKEEVAKLCLL